MIFCALNNHRRANFISGAFKFGQNINIKNEYVELQFEENHYDGNIFTVMTTLVRLFHTSSNLSICNAFFLIHIFRSRLINFFQNDPIFWSSVLHDLYIKLNMLRYVTEKIFVRSLICCGHSFLKEKPRILISLNVGPEFSRILWMIIWTNQNISGDPKKEIKKKIMRIDPVDQILYHF